MPASRSNDYEVAILTDLDVLFVQTQICPRTRKEARALKEAGVRVHLLETNESAPHQDYGAFVTHTTLGEPKDLRGLLLNGRRIRRRIRDHIAAHPYDIIHTHNGPDTLGAWIPRLTSRPVVHDIHDIQTFIPTSYATGFRRVVIDRLTERWQQQACQRTAAVFTVSPWMGDILQRRYATAKMFSFENKVFKADHERLPRLSASDGETHIVYAGGFHFREGEARNMLPDIRIWAGAGIHVHLYPVFFDERHREILRDMVRDEPYIHVHDLCPQDRFVEEMTQYDWGLIWFRATTENIRLAAPNRLYEFQVAGVPILTNLEDGFTGDYVRAKGCGLVVGSAEEAIAAVREEHTFTFDTEDCYMDGGRIARAYAEVLAATGAAPTKGA